MKQETRDCQNCKTAFVIEPEDFDFYKKIAVPPPTWCPECRLIVRRTFRNERTLYHRRCGLCGKEVISMFSPSASFPVYCRECWWSDGWDAGSYGKDIDFSKPFLEQVKELHSNVPRSAMVVQENIDSPYVNYTWHSRNSYMCWDLGYGENVMYSNACHFLKDSSDCSYSKKLEFCYELINSKECSRSAYLRDCDNCLDSFFLRSCKNCSSCILCENLRNKKYCIGNRQYTKDEYEKKLGEYLGDRENIEAAKRKFNNRLRGTIVKESNNIQTIRCTGDNIWQSKNCLHSFNVYKSENCKFVNDVDSDLKDGFDLSNAAEGELMYSGTSVSGSRVLFGIFITSSFDISLSAYIHENSSHLFACVGLRNKQYCILNKQYTKEEYESLVPRIIKHMNEMPYVDAKGRVYKYGEFFPPDLSPFAYNETIAQEYFPLTKEEAIKQGYRWKDPDTKQYTITKKPEALPDHIKDTDDSILKETIGCAHHGTCLDQCTTAFKIIPEELQFYKRMNLPLPRLCPNCRHYERLRQRNPLKLWHRQCMCDGKTYHNTGTHAHGAGRCPAEFETSYAPDRPEIVYCEQCYNAEVA